MRKTKNPQNRLKQTNQPQINLETLKVNTKNFTVIGKRGYGKTTAAKKIISLIKGKTIIILDSLAEYTGDYSFTTFKEFDDHLRENGLRLKTYVCRFENEWDYENVFCLISDYDFVQNVFLVVEEADLYCKPSWIHPCLAQIIKYGRHRNNTYLGIARRTAEINNLIISQSHYAISFRQSLPDDVDKLKKYGFSDNLPNLEVFEYEGIEI